MGSYSGLNTQDGVEHTAEGGGQCVCQCKDDLFEVSCHDGEGVGDVYLGLWGRICDRFIGREIPLVGEQPCHGDESEVSIEFLAHAALTFAVDVFEGGGVFEGFIKFFDGPSSVIEVCKSVEGIALGVDQCCCQHEAAVFDGIARQAERDGALGRRDAVGLHVAEGVLWRHEVQVDVVLVSLAEGV